jgi:hypothetical protein
MKYRRSAAAVAFAMSLASRSACADPVAGIRLDYNAPDPNRDAFNYARGFANLLVADYVIYQIDWFRSQEWALVTRQSIATNVTSSFQFDYDALSEDLLGHPLHGSLYFNAGRAAGLSFWESALFPVIGSLSWEYAGERQVTFPGGWRSKPSTNDFVATATSGTLLGEALYRISTELLDDSTTGFERVVRELGASVVSPMRGFNRLYTGEMWRSGPPPERSHPLHVALDGGISRLALLGSPKTFKPGALLALELQYGDLLPSGNRSTLAPFEFFQGYVAFTELDDQISGSQAYGNALVYGWSGDMSAKGRPFRDNNVFGIVSNFDFQGADNSRFGAMSIGPGNYLVWRFGTRRQLRLGLDIDWTYLLGTDSPFAGPTTGHNFSMGPGIGVNGLAEVGQFGQLDLRSRYYLGAVIDGQGREEVVGYSRLAYAVEVLPHVGFGAASTLRNQRSSSGTRSAAETSLEGQLYLRLSE